MLDQSDDRIFVDQSVRVDSRSQRYTYSKTISFKMPSAAFSLYRVFRHSCYEVLGEVGQTQTIGNHIAVHGRKCIDGAAATTQNK